jgi:urea transport system substrate-binding protein
VTNDPMEAHVIGFAMWVKAVEKVKSTDPDKVIDALPGTEAPNLTGGTSKMLPNHHITKRCSSVKCGRTASSTWSGKRRASFRATHGRRSLTAPKDLVGDWVAKKCGNYNVKTNKCGGA